MDGNLSVSDFDHVILDSKGIRGVKDGTEHPISEEEWKRAHPEHRDTECKECTFVQDQATLSTFFVPRELKEKATEEPIFVGKFTMPGWTGHSGFYLFKCASCGEAVVDYPHGYHQEFVYLRCGNCQECLDLAYQKDIYKREQLHLPLIVRLISIAKKLESKSWSYKRRVGKRLKRALRKMMAKASLES